MSRHVVDHCSFHKDLEWYYVYTRAQINRLYTQWLTVLIQWLEGILNSEMRRNFFTLLYFAFEDDQLDDNSE